MGWISRGVHFQGASVTRFGRDPTTGTLTSLGATGVGACRDRSVVQLEPCGESARVRWPTVWLQRRQYVSPGTSTPNTESVAAPTTRTGSASQSVVSWKDLPAR